VWINDAAINLPAPKTKKQVHGSLPAPADTSMAKTS